MKVTILNPEELENLYKNHGEFACVCYATNPKYASKVGKACEESGHMSGSRCEYIKFKIEGIDRGTAEQNLRHEIGTSVPYEMQDNYNFSDYSEMVIDVSPDQIVKNMASFRYIDKTGFEWETPYLIKKHPEVKEQYDNTMEYIQRSRRTMLDMLIALGEDRHASNEAVNFVLTRATKSEFVIGFTPEALIHFMHKRLCTRAQEFIHKLANEMRKAVAEVNSEFAKELVPHCQYLLWCPEKDRCCGRYPTRDELLKKIKKGKESNE